MVENGVRPGPISREHGPVQSKEFASLGKRDTELCGEPLRFHLVEHAQAADLEACPFDRVGLRRRPGWDRPGGESRRSGRCRARAPRRERRPRRLRLDRGRPGPGSRARRSRARGPRVPGRRDRRARQSAAAGAGASESRHSERTKESPLRRYVVWRWIERFASQRVHVTSWSGMRAD